VRAAILTEAGKVEIQNVPEPELLAGSLIVEIIYCGVGGSDSEAFASGLLPAPAWFGHEWVGRVVEVGDGVVGHFPGERVVGAVSPPCGTCDHCSAGMGQWCKTSLEMILGADAMASSHGAFAERIRVDARRVVAVPEGVDDRDAALAEPASVAAHAIVRSELSLGDIVVVVGAGTIGGLVIKLAKLNGASRVLVIEPNSDRRELACDLGASAAFPPGREAADWLAKHGHGLGADVGFSCSGHADALASAVQACRLGGTVVAVGVSGESGALASLPMIAREITLRASRGYGVADVQRTLDLISDDRLRVGAMVHPGHLGLDGLASHLAGQTDELGMPKYLLAPSS
jgi:(R,R)-butanediol dehydrogenase/meso-butanediol dehydrogenase/diacetyl reductase